MSSPAIALHGVTKRFGRTLALDDVSFTVAPGEVVGFVGPNGSGKTTTLRIVCGFLDADAGTIEVSGHDVMRDRALAQASIGYMPESVPLHGDMRVREYLGFRARLKGLGRAHVRERVVEVCATAGLMGHERRIIGQLSKGFRQRVGLADALLGAPPILLLDEPSAGLDPVQVRELRELVARLATSHTIVISSHVLSEIEAMTRRVIMLVGGRVVGDGAMDELGAAAGVPAGSSLEDVFVALAGKARASGEQGAS